MIVDSTNLVTNREESLMFLRALSGSAQPSEKFAIQSYQAHLPRPSATEIVTPLPLFAVLLGCVHSRGAGESQGPQPQDPCPQPSCCRRWRRRGRTRSYTTHRPALRALDAATIESIGEGLGDWASVDTLGTRLAGPAWVNGQITEEDVHRWARSPDRWWRRAALVATTGLNVKTRGGHGDARRTLGICEMLADDHDDMVVEAMSWALS